jgi:hypothetical protein
VTYLHIYLDLQGSESTLVHDLGKKNWVKLHWTNGEKLQVQFLNPNLWQSTHFHRKTFSITLHITKYVFVSDFKSQKLSCGVLCCLSNGVIWRRDFKFTKPVFRLWIFLPWKGNLLLFKSPVFAFLLWKHFLLHFTLPNFFLLNVVYFWSILFKMILLHFFHGEKYFFMTEYTLLTYSHCEKYLGSLFGFDVYGRRDVVEQQCTWKNGTKDPSFKVWLWELLMYVVVGWADLLFVRLMKMRRPIRARYNSLDVSDTAYWLTLSPNVANWYVHFSVSYWRCIRIPL